MQVWVCGLSVQKEQCEVGVWRQSCSSRVGGRNHFWIAKPFKNMASLANASVNSVGAADFICSYSNQGLQVFQCALFRSYSSGDDPPTPDGQTSHTNKKFNETREWESSTCPGRFRYSAPHSLFESRVPGVYGQPGDQPLPSFSYCSCRHHTFFFRLFPLHPSFFFHSLSLPLSSAIICSIFF